MLNFLRTLALCWLIVTISPHQSAASGGGSSSLKHITFAVDDVIAYAQNNNTWYTSNEYFYETTWEFKTPGTGYNYIQVLKSFLKTREGKQMIKNEIINRDAYEDQHRKYSWYTKSSDEDIKKLILYNVAKQWVAAKLLISFKVPDVIAYMNGEQDWYPEYLRKKEGQSSIQPVNTYLASAQGIAAIEAEITRRNTQFIDHVQRNITNPQTGRDSDEDLKLAILRKLADSYLDAIQRPFIQQVKYLIAADKRDDLLNYLCGGVDGKLLKASGPTHPEFQVFAEGIALLTTYYTRDSKYADIEINKFYQKIKQNHDAQGTFPKTKVHVDMICTTLKMLARYYNEPANQIYLKENGVILADQALLGLINTEEGANAPRKPEHVQRIWDLYNAAKVHVTQKSKRRH
jgi:hypothetical protein